MNRPDVLQQDKEPESPKQGIVFLIPTVLAEDGYDAIPAYIKNAVEACSCFFVEHERTARRYLKKIWPGIVIDQYGWYVMDKNDPSIAEAFRQVLRQGGSVGILSEAGCPGVADPGQELVTAAQQIGAKVRPLSGPSSILLALMASGMNGQLFRFNGYLPVEPDSRKKTLRDLESDSHKTGCTHIFIETPYRNDAMLDSILQTCRAESRLCVAVNISSAAESIRTMRISEWKKQKPVLHKIPVIFLLSAG
jgi:16S rRNA (cytidine1402-2'-O)-methyltransferase